MFRTAISAMLALFAFLACGETRPAQAQAGPPGLAGSWELSNASRERRCVIVLNPGAVPRGFAVQAGDGCAKDFAFIREVAAWQAVPPVGLQLLTAAGAVIVEFTAVEDGLFEGERPADGILFMQNLASRAAEERSVAQTAGNWRLVAPRGNSDCGLELSPRSVGGESYAVALRPGCDTAIVRFNPVSWRFDRGQLLLVSQRGENWRFEEADSITWHRVPVGRQPLHLVRD